MHPEKFPRSMMAHFQRFWEMAFPYVAAAAACAALAYINARYLVCSPRAVSDLLPNALNILGIAISFLAASQAVLLSLADRPFVERLRQTGTYTRLHQLFSQTICVLLLAVLLSVALTVMPHTKLYGTPRVFFWLVLAWVFLCLAGAINALRLVLFFSSIVRHSTRKV